MLEKQEKGVQVSFPHGIYYIDCRTVARHKNSQQSAFLGLWHFPVNILVPEVGGGYLIKNQKLSRHGDLRPFCDSFVLLV